MTLSFIRVVIPLSLAEYLIHSTQLKCMNKQEIKCMNILEGGRKEDFNIEEVHPEMRKQGSIVVTHPQCRLIIKSREEQKGRK